MKITLKFSQNHYAEFFCAFINDCHVFAKKEFVVVENLKSKKVEFHVEIESSEMCVLEVIKDFYDRFCTCMGSNGSFKDLFNDMEEYLEAADEAWRNNMYTPSIHDFLIND